MSKLWSAALIVAILTFCAARSWAAPELVVASWASGGIHEGIQRYNQTTGAYLGDLVPDGSGGLIAPVSFEVNSEGNLLVLDYQQALKYALPSGTPLSTFIPVASGIGVSWDMKIGPDNKLYVASVSTHSVMRFDPSSGAFLDTFIPTGSGGFMNSFEIAFRNGQLYALNGTGSNASQVLRYDATSGAFLGTLVNTPNFLRTFTFGLDGDILAPANNSGVLRFDGTTGALKGNFLVGGDQSTFATAVTFGPGNDLYVGLASGKVLRYDGVTGAYESTLVNAGTMSEPLEMEFMEIPEPATFASAMLIGGGWMLRRRRRR